MKDLVRIWDQTTLLDQIITVGGAGVAAPARAFAVAGIAARSSVTLVVLPRSRDAEAFAGVLGEWMDPAAVRLFPSWEVMPGEALSPTLETMGRRLKIAADLLRPEVSPSPLVVVASVRAMLQKLAPPAGEPVVVTKGAGMPLDELAETLVALGFERNYLVERAGEFSVRGGIVDIFPAGRERPIRLDYFGDEISDLREFSVSSQRSQQQIERAEIGACRELRPLPEVRRRALDAAGTFPEDSVQAADLNRIAEGLIFPGMEGYLALIGGPLQSLTEFLPKGSHVVVADPKQCRDGAAKFLEQVVEWGGEAASGLFDDLETAQWLQDAIQFWPYARGEEGLDLDLAGWDNYSGNLENLSSRLTELISHGVSVAVAAGRGADRAKEILAEAGLGLPIEDARPGAAVISRAGIGKGFLLNLDGQPALAVVGEEDLFGRRRPLGARSSEVPARASALLLQLAAGDYVVHDTYGVGRYHGMVTREVAGISRDYLIISYFGEDKLYLPTEQLEAISTYTGGDSPRLNRLGSADWEKSKARARRSVADIAGELTVLYSRRMHSPGHPFSPDTPWQAELENSFPYIDTPDQQRAVEEVKADMEKPIPMDRLICGDVGYGKTEVAVRAVFKAVQDSKQTAVLVPTTILAQQHFQTFSERFSGYPIKLAQLSRFLSPGEQKQVLESTAAGKVDVIIGTHRLLQPDVRFHDLGLLVVDEEQRFGVKHKEKIKKLRENVDVLTLTATPIPRTLEMGITGIRDLSLMDTPPADRRPVLTYVGESEDRMIAAAIRRELSRDGQVFFVHNRVRSIKGTARRIAGLVPGARVEVAHGQMDEHELERVMVAVWDGKVDVLVCTTIIESGLDIPAMNTLIVERADRLGLSQLYQLRGRVGRARQRAYAYFLYPHDAVLGDEAHERLKTLSEFTELGSGFKIALRDLEIRGAGNLLGAEQSGHIAAVGFDLYLKMMSEAIADLAGKPHAKKVDVRLDLPADAFIPAGYIARDSLRMDAYRQIEKVRSKEQAAALGEELSDRYGPIPESVANLLAVAELRALLDANGVGEAVLRDGVLKVKPLPALSESQELRIKARFGEAAYKPSTHTLLLPAPARDIPKWALQTLSGVLS